MKTLIFLFSLFFFTISQSQEISFSKDSLAFNDNTGLYFSSDTTFIINTGQATLIIDTIYSKHYYGYSLNIYYNDTTIYNPIALPLQTLDLIINVGDTAMFVFSNPDLCPICKTSTSIQPFVDSIIIHSNSLTNPYSYLYCSGYGMLSGIKDELNNQPVGYLLEQNYPNPFNMKTVIRYHVPISCHVKIELYNIKGERKYVLVDEQKVEGYYEVLFNADRLASGIYFYRIQAGEYIKTKKFILMK